MGEQETALGTELDDILLGLPNLPFAGVPEGDDEESNVQQGNGWGDPRKFDFTPKDHADLGEALVNAKGQSMMDFESAVAMSGSRFVALRGDLARMERALSAFMLDVQTQENGYEEVSPPLVVRDNAMRGTGQLPKFDEDAFHVQSYVPAESEYQPATTQFGEQSQRAVSKRRWLIPTAEVPLTNLVREQILEASALPLRMTCLLYTSPSPRDQRGSRMPSSA